MNKSCLLIIIISTTFYAAYYSGYRKGSANIDSGEQVNATNDIKTVETLSQTPTTEDPVTETTSEGTATIKHKVQAGETLFLVGLKYDVLWTTIAETNNLSEDSALIEGQELIIPINEDGNITKEESLNINEEDVKKTQALVAKGEMSWRTDPVEVLKRTAPLDYHLKNSDIFTLIELNKDEGKAIIEVLHDNQKLIVNLVQPLEKGDNGVWYIINIKVT